MNTGFVYLGSPYSHADAEVRELRYQGVMSATAWLLAKKIWTYSPIVHTHVLAKQHQLPFEYEFWHEYNKAMIRGASRLWVLCLDGWEQSKGLSAEIQFARDHGFQVLFMKLAIGDQGANYDLGSVP